MRSSLTPSEQALWAQLSARRLVEVDGGSHLQCKRRDAVLTRAGYRIVRLDAARVLQDLEAALALVRSAL